MTIEYSSLRREVMIFYLKTWGQPRLIVGRMTIFATSAMAFLLLVARGRAPSPPEWTGALACGLFVLALLPLYPLWQFKPQKRVLITDSWGIKTIVGTRSGSVPWTDVASIREDGDRIVIQRSNGNAFVVPDRAFSASSQRSQFLTEANAWHQAAGMTAKP